MSPIRTCPSPHSHSLAWLGLFCATATAASGATLVVEAGDSDRHDTLVEFQLPPETKPGSVLLSEGRPPVPVQIGADRRGWFVEPGLKRGEQRRYRLAPGAAPTTAEAVVRAVEGKGSVTFSAFGKKAFVYRTEQTDFPPDRPDLTPVFHRGGYIHPVLTPDGRQLTDDYPANHKHHHGIWFAWTHTEFEGRTPDFWNMGDGKGTVEFVAVDRTWSGPVCAGLTSRHRQVDLTVRPPKVALHETWRVQLYAIGRDPGQAKFVFDIEVTDTCAGDAPLKLPKYRYGGIGVRANGAWDGVEHLNFLNSEGSTDRSKGDNNETRGRWAHLGGKAGDGLIGLAVLGHPDNANAPQPQRIHPTEPFLSFAPQQAGDLEIVPGQSFRARYRFVAAAGAPDRQELDRLWNDYAHPPRVSIE